MQLDIRLDSTEALTGVEPGCGLLRNEKTRELFRLGKLDGSILVDYTTFKQQLEADRPCLDQYSIEAFNLLANDLNGPIGGIMVFNIVLLGEVDGVIEYRAACGPLIRGINRSADIMLHLLDNTTEGVDDDDNPVTMQLKRWSFPRDDVRNRWDISRPRPSAWLDIFQENHVVITETQGGQEYITVLRK